jgi:hypothetical protein
MTLIILHLIVAFGGIVASTAAAIAPTHNKIRLTYSLIGLTLLSGTILVVSSHSALLPSCLTGLLYLGISTSGLAIAEFKLNKN